MDLPGNSEEVGIRIIASGVASEGMLRPGARPICATEDGIKVGCQEQVQGPAARSVDSLAVVLIDGVEVGMLLAIDDDGNESIVEELGDCRVGKGVLCGKAAV